MKQLKNREELEVKHAPQQFSNVSIQQSIAKKELKVAYTL
jgi:hypothetical protein